MHKQIEQPLDIGQPVELTTFLEGQDTPFIITGDYAALAPIAEALREADSQLAAR